jgi:hypothetical protein
MSHGIIYNQKNAKISHDLCNWLFLPLGGMPFLKNQTLNFGICSILFGPAGRFPPPAVQRSETVAALQYEG